MIACMCGGVLETLLVVAVFSGISSLGTHLYNKWGAKRHREKCCDHVCKAEMPDEIQVDRQVGR